jgi:hypothetical protein
MSQLIRAPTGSVNSVKEIFQLVHLETADCIGHDVLTLTLCLRYLKKMLAIYVWGIICAKSFAIREAIREAVVD